jgi:preprotein translocase subunit SecB
MQIQLLSTKAIKIDLQPEECNEEEFFFNYNTHFDDDFKVRTFKVSFHSKIMHKENFQCEVIYLAEFTTDGDLDEKFRHSGFANVNAPAIGYPFLRAFLANLLLNSGLEQSFLPSINFEALWKEKKQEKLDEIAAIEADKIE